MSRRTSIIRRPLLLLTTLCFLFTSTWQTVATAQTQVDFEPPVIEDQPLATGIAGEPQEFTALVTDNQQLKSVSLFYRFNDQPDFQQEEMELAVARYLALITSSSDNQQYIEYYIQAEDSSGNIVLKGNSFQPLKRLLNQPAVTSSQSANADTAPPPQEKKSKVLYYILGALAVGVAAALAGGGGGSSGSDPSDSCNNSGCNVTVVVSSP